MPSLAESQSRFIQCLQKGPDHLPAELFSESAERALLGMKAHANTVSHARLVALEDSFPRLLAHIGQADFNQLSRDYIEQDHVMARDMNMIAADFADYLQQRGADATATDLARIEWAWLDSYRAADAEPVALTDIASLGEEALLAFPVVQHPSLRLLRLSGPLSPELGELADHDPDALMIARPEAAVLLHPLTAQEYELAGKITKISTMGNLLEHAIELTGEAAAMEHIIKLVQAGALTRFKR